MRFPNLGLSNVQHMPGGLPANSVFMTSPSSKPSNLYVFHSTSSNVAPTSAARTQPALQPVFRKNMLFSFGANDRADRDLYIDRYVCQSLSPPQPITQPQEMSEMPVDRRLLSARLKQIRSHTYVHIYTYIYIYMNESIVYHVIFIHTT